MKAIVRRARSFAGEAVVPGDKSISHRALILAALAEGVCRIEGLATGEDVRSTERCLRALGVRIEREGDAAIVHGVGLHGLRAPTETLDCGNSGTTMRLLAGVLAGSGVGGTLDGDESLRRRPMERVLAPLRAMGARCTSTEGRAPLHMEPGAKLRGVDHALQVASAQVKSALLLAGLWADGETSVREPVRSRDHTERMLAALGAPIHFDAGASSRENDATEDHGALEPARSRAPLNGKPPHGAVPTPSGRGNDATEGQRALSPSVEPKASPTRDAHALATNRSEPGAHATIGPADGKAPPGAASRPTGGAPPIRIRRPHAPLRAPSILHVPGDPSSAAFLLAAALFVPGGSITVRGIDANPTRLGFLDVLDRMGADAIRIPRGEAAGDPVIDVAIHHRPLRATIVEPAEIPALVDEVPLLAVLATTAEGTTEIRGAGELRVKESDRLAATALGLRAMGADVDELPDGLRIRGPTPLRGAALHAHGDHRIAMAFAIAGLAAEGETTIDAAECADVSFPGFYALLAQLTAGAVRTT